MRTSVCDMLGIEFPIFAFSHCRDVVAAVSKAGGFGVLGVARLTPDELETELRWIEKEVGDRPFGVDAQIPAKLYGDESGAELPREELEAQIPERHRKFINDLLARYGVPELPPQLSDEKLPYTIARDAFSREKEVALLEVALRHPIRLIASALGPPPAHLVDAAHRKGVRIAGLVGAKKHVRKQLDAGVDLIIAQSYEAAGHTGDIGGMVLIPEVVDAAGPVPVLAAGGIASGRQFAAALALGAQGVWCGSVWLTTEEAETHPLVKEKLLRATSSDTVRTLSESGKPCRQLRTAWAEEWEGPDSPGSLPSPLQWLLCADALERIQRAAYSSEGARKLMGYSVGQVVGSLNEVKPVHQVIFDMVDGCLNVAQGFADTLSGNEELDR
ncbi:nitronate monooxygenase [Bradyrhizobium sp. CCBAU 11361]|uniref:nitronate monooxygenase n=1 Tax=Bradyrhizobium sp. CCBAU 11361 TaxID=1630812 RepID=UPI002302AC4E|nr:nitronate monooxygenase family protein [Bradyrhizobium sp. CCBAU 11361]MDA9489685.1 monooxygenase [Bradyrhizobium sp. CCBAU 11361]